jgi:hypothetical protein
MRRIFIVLLFVFLGGWLLSCSSIPEVSKRTASPYKVTTQNSTYVGFFITIQPASMSDISRVELWYENKPVADGQLLDEKDGIVQMVFKGWFEIYANRTATIKIFTQKGEVHDIPIGDPVVNEGREYTGTQYRL